MILVTGAAGKTGRAVTSALARRGVEVRALVHRPEQVAVARAAGATAATVGDQRDRSTLRAALADCDAVYAIAPNMSGDEQTMGAAVIDACAATSTRLVYHSVIHPMIESLPHHWDKLRVEERLVESGLDWTVLRPNAYLDNIAAYLPAAADDGVLAVPYGVDVRAAMVDLADVAEVAASVLTGSGHGHASYDLSGPVPVTPRDIAEALSRALGRPVAAEQVVLADWAAGPGADLDDVTRGRLLAMFRHYDAHGVPGNATTLSHLLGRAPNRLADVVVRLVAGWSARTGSK